MIEFDWDVENLTHIAEHDVTPEEVEFALQNDPLEIEYQDWHESEPRFAEIGVTQAGRFLYLLTTFREERIRPVTAYDAPVYRIKEYLRGRSW